MSVKTGKELIKSLEEDLAAFQRSIENRQRRIDNWETDEDDCFISIRTDERGLQLVKDKLALIKDGGCAWFPEYATLDGQLINARWCKCRSFTGYGTEYKLRMEMPDGSVQWTTATTAKGLAKRGVKRVLCKRPAWYKFQSSAGGMLGVYTGEYVLFPSSINYATGEEASEEPLEVKEWEE